MCAPGATECVGNAIRTCTAKGEWGLAAPCPDALPICMANECSDPSSCQNLPTNCGPLGNESCCTSILVPGGPFNRVNDPNYPATVSAYRLDKYEVTVGRFRKFFNEYPNNKPVSGAGAQPQITGSGWDPAWDANLPATQSDLQLAIQCAGLPSWTPTPGGNENKAIACVDWYLLFAFCAWDGGFLPTDAQWNYAAAGGNEQRDYPWGAAMPDATYATYGCNGVAGDPMCVAADLLNVGALSPKGDGRFGHADLGGGMFEWMLDKFSSPYTIANCNDCAEIVTGASRVMRGGDWRNSMPYLFNSSRSQGGPMFRLDYLAGRCARRP
jgi:formylglycine-generating enzyme